MDPYSSQSLINIFASSATTSIILDIAIIVLLIIISAFLASAETAFSCCNKNRIKSNADAGEKSAKRVQKIIDNTDKSIVAILIAINVAHILTSTLATVLFVRLLGEKGSIVSTVVITILVFIFSETLPKNIAKAKADKLILKYAPTIQALIYILYPLVLLFSWPYKLMNKAKDTSTDEYNEDDLSNMVETIEEEGVLEEDESTLIQNAIEFDDIKAIEVYTPIEKMEGIDIRLSKKEIINRLLKENTYSRLPVYDGSKEKVIGVLTVRYALQELLFAKKFDIRKLMFKPYLINQATNLDDVLDGFSKNKTHMGFIVDRNKKIIGIITMDDVLDELVEDIEEDTGDVYE